MRLKVRNAKWGSGARGGFAFVAIAALFAVLVLAGCGGSDPGTPADGERTDRTAAAHAQEPKEVTLVLDFLPGPVHAGIYHALHQGWYEEAGIELRIVEPTSTADTLRLIDAGQAHFGVADGVDVALQIDQGRDAQAILALTQRPSGGLIALADSDFTTPADFEGATIGVTGVPSDDAVLETILADRGLGLDDVEKVTIGFNGVQALANRRVDGFVGFIPADGVQLELDGSPIQAFPFDEYGGPQYPGLVVFSTRSQLVADPELAAAFVAATARGYEAVIDNPELGIESLLAETVGITPELAEAGFDAYESLFVADADRFGVFHERHIAETIDFLAEVGLIDEPIATDRYYTDEFLAQGD